jgi:pyrrolidone-carboxylate peptidase
VSDNPSGRLAEAVDGQIVAGVHIVGRRLPVSYERGPAEAIAVARQVGATLVIGLGVAQNTDRVRVERWASRVCSADVPDIDGVCVERLGEPERVHASLDVAALAAALDADVSTDAGQYVCNAWLYRTAAALDVPVGFVHIPPSGMPAEQLLHAISAIL